MADIVDPRRRSELMAGIRGRLALPSQQRRAVPLRYAQRVPVYDRHRGPEGCGGEDPEQLDGSDLNGTPAGGQHRASGTADLWLVVPLSRHRAPSE